MIELTKLQEDIYSGKVCPYCNSKTKVVSEEFIYGKNYKGRSIICCSNYPECDAYVGTHEEDGSSLGRLAKKPLRQYRNAVHHNFDKLWKEKYLTRNEAYEQLSEYLAIPFELTHTGMFGIETCKKAIEWSIKKYNTLRNANHNKTTN